MPKAFPSAYGYGTDVNIGGRQGVVLFIDNLNDSGPGSARAAFTASGPRMIIPRVGGTVALTSDIVVSNPYVTYAGQAAPGDGLLFKNYDVTINTHDVIFRFLQVHPGDHLLSPPRQTGPILVYGTNAKYNITLDHCTAAWATDECLSVYGNVWYNVTLQWCLIGEGRISGGIAPNHSYGSLVGTGWWTGTAHTTSIHHNLYMCCAARMPECNAYAWGSGGAGAPALIADVRYNVMYNWNTNGGPTRFVRNFYSQGEHDSWVANAGGESCH